MSRYVKRLGFNLTAITMLLVMVMLSASPVLYAQSVDDETRLRKLQNAPWVDTTKPAPVCGDGTSLPNGTPEQNGQAIFDFFVSKGLQPFQSAGIIGNMVVESGLEPQRLQGTPPGKITTADQAANSSGGGGGSYSGRLPVNSLKPMVQRRMRRPISSALSSILSGDS